MGKSIQLLLLKDHESGPKTATIGNWPGQALYSPLKDAHSILDRKELDRPGVYVLKSEPEDSLYGERVYIGESDSLKSRIKTHIKDISKGKKDDFNEFVIFSSRDSLLHKGTIGYLESLMIYQAHAAKTAEITNRSKVPPESKPLSEADRINSLEFLKQMKLLLPILGFRFLIPTTVPIPPEKEKIKPAADLYKIVGKQVKAFMFISDDGFVVTKGSQANIKNSKSIGIGYIRLRKKLQTEGTLIQKETFLEFTEGHSIQQCQHSIISSVGQANHWTSILD